MIGINNFGNYGIGNYPVRNIPVVDVETVKEQDEIKKRQEETGLGLYTKETDASAANTSAKEDNRPKTTNLENISLTFNKDEDFGYIGNDSDIMKLDMEKAISDMKKDQAFEQYQFFVGSGKTMQNEDGSVFLK